MLMTEEQAFKKRCTPSLLLLLLDPEQRNAHAASGARMSANCIGSACAQWTWYDYVNANAETWRAAASGGEFSKGRASANPGSVKCEARGYCGLTGGKS